MLQQQEATVSRKPRSIRSRELGDELEIANERLAATEPPELLQIRNGEKGGLMVDVEFISGHKVELWDHEVTGLHPSA